MAGIEVVASYEWWNKANRTNHKNNGHVATETDIRQLRLEDIPRNIDIVVGSPPCTQFSYANRGGRGDIADGLKDIAKFLAVVDHVGPTFWAMENVPRVASIIENEMRDGGKLAQFAHLRPTVRIIDTCEWGVPQKRLRCIAGNFDFALLESYKARVSARTLGDVVRALALPKVKDPIFGIELSKDVLRDHVIEEFLMPEEERMNREMKTYHPVYNNMSFPDSLDRAARTITATCTRVSRESVVIAAPEKKGCFRRLTIRERGCLQSFPITYQFYGDSYAEKLKMIGNAVPPLFTYHVAQAMLGVKVDKIAGPSVAIKAFSPPKEAPPRTLPDTAGGSYPPTRRFRAAIPNLRFKSGVRFELANCFEGDVPLWNVKFFFGNSKNIREIAINDGLLKKIKSIKQMKKVWLAVALPLSKVVDIIASTDAASLQSVWAHTTKDGRHPYDLVDAIGRAAEEIIAILAATEGVAARVIAEVLMMYDTSVGSAKVLKYSDAVLAGLLVGAASNALLTGKVFNKVKS